MNIFPSAKPTSVVVIRVVYNEVKNTAAQRVLHSGRRCGCGIVSEMGLRLFSSTSHIIMHS